MERTLMPIGVASINLTCRICSLKSRYMAGKFFPGYFSFKPGIRLSRISVVLPEPDTPVITVSLPCGISTSNGFTV